MGNTGENVRSVLKTKFSFRQLHLTVPPCVHLLFASRLITAVCCEILVFVTPLEHFLL